MSAQSFDITAGAVGDNDIGSSKTMIFFTSPVIRFQAMFLEIRLNISVDE